MMSYTRGLSSLLAGVWTRTASAVTGPVGVPSRHRTGPHAATIVVVACRSVFIGRAALQRHRLSRTQPDTDSSSAGSRVTSDEAHQRLQQQQHEKQQQQEEEKSQQEEEQQQKQTQNQQQQQEHQELAMKQQQKQYFWSKESTEGRADTDTSATSLAIYEHRFAEAAAAAAAGHSGRTKAAFTSVIESFCRDDPRRRGHVDFVYAALRCMRDYGVHRDIAVYNRLLDIIPKGVFVPRNVIQRTFNHYPRQQQCGIAVLEQMENYGLMPDKETRSLLIQIYGQLSHPYRKYRRILYWFPRMKHMNPYPVPVTLPSDPVTLASLALTRMADDLDAKVTVYQSSYNDVTEDGRDVTKPYIVGIQTPAQQELLSRHRPERPVYVEGPSRLWLRDANVSYYVLRGDPLAPHEKNPPIDPERSLYYPLQLDLDLTLDPSDDFSFDVQEVEEGPVFAMCMVGCGDQATLGHWLSGLQLSNPVLGRTPIIFRLESTPSDLVPGGGSHGGRGNDSEGGPGEERTK
ncbi:unnamed protein product [Lampetra fluviatilis]